MIQQSGQTAGVPIEDWMSEQSVVCIDTCCACGSKESAMRRNGRRVKFKQLALQEMDCRYKIYENIMLPEEKESFQQIKEKFTNGLYRSIMVIEFVGTFYTPLSFFFQMLPCVYKLFFPFTQFCVKKLWPYACGKDQHLRFYVYCFLIMVAPLIPFYLITDIILMPFLYLLYAIFEILLMLCSFLCYFGVYRLRKKGVFVYTYKVILVTGTASTTRTNGTRSNTKIVTIQDVGSSVEIKHYPPRRFLHRRPIEEIFRGMNMDFFTFGDIEGLTVTNDDIERLEKLNNIAKSLQEDANKNI